MKILPFLRGDTEGFPPRLSVLKLVKASLGYQGLDVVDRLCLSF